MCVVYELSYMNSDERCMATENMYSFRMESTPPSSLIALTFVLESWNKGPIGRMVNYMYVHCTVYTVNCTLYSTLYSTVSHTYSNFQYC